MRADLELLQSFYRYDLDKVADIATAQAEETLRGVSKSADSSVTFRMEDLRLSRDEAAAVAADQLPRMMFFHWSHEPQDIEAGQFVNPLDVTPELDKSKTYSLDFSMEVLHTDDLLDSLGINSKKPLEHRLYTKSPVEFGGRRDWMDWIVASGIDVFLQSDREGRDQKLQKFAEGSTPTKVLKGAEQIVVESGRVRMAQGVWGHRKKHFFAKFWNWMSAAFSSPLLGAAGIPALVGQSVGFVNKILQDYQSEAELRTLWNTKEMPFRIDPAVPVGEAPYGLRSGYWIIIDSSYAQQNQDLDGHFIDYRYGTFEVLNAQGNPIAAPYLVSSIRLDEVESSE